MYWNIVFGGIFHYQTYILDKKWAQELKQVFTIKTDAVTSEDFKVVFASKNQIFFSF